MRGALRHWTNAKRVTLLCSFDFYPLDVSTVQRSNWYELDLLLLAYNEKLNVTDYKLLINSIPPITISSCSS